MKKRYIISTKTSKALAGKATEYYINNGINALNKNLHQGKVPENTGILLTETTRKITSQEGGF